MDDIEAGQPAPRRHRFPAVALVGAGLAAGIVVAGLTSATAQTAPSPSAPADAPDGRRLKRGHPGGPGKHGLGLGRGALHGEFTVPDTDGDGYRRMATQNGEVTAVSATSVTVRSEDGFSRTYVVTGDTQVNSADEGIGDVATGDRVHVLAVLDGDTATAIRVVDRSELGRLRDKWGPPRAPKPTASPS